MDPEEQVGLLAPTPENLAKVKVFPLIAALRKDITKTIDSALSWEQLTAADINFSIVRPLINKYARLRNISVVYTCLVVRQYFLSESEVELAFAGVMLSRASLCEIMAIKLLNRFATNYIQLVAVLTTGWSPLAGASAQVLEDVKQTMNSDSLDVDAAQSAIEMAIATEAKDFLASPIAQKVVNDIYSGRVVFTVTANRSILADNYKPRGIEIYDPKRTPFLDHYRLRVPKYGTYLEFINFALLLLTFMLCLSNQDKAHLSPWEIAFIVFATAFTLEEYTASTGHGWIIYIANIWNAFDFTFIVIFLAYMGLRVKGLSNNNLETSAMAFDVLACGACILFPRLAFFFVSDNLVILSLRAMIAQFVFFISIAAICFSGLLFTLWTLAGDNPDGKNWTVAQISWLMVQIWFGNTSLSFAQASSFHPMFGPILMTVFAALSNTLLLTILISILSNTVARIDANAAKESLFQYTISTVEGVKSDALFSYQPPFNILAFVILKPLSFMLSPRYLHTANVFLIRLTSLPQLLVIALYERHLADGRKLRETSRDAAQSLYNSLPKHIKNMPLVEALVGSTDSELFDAIFDVEIGDEDMGKGLWDEEDEDEDEYENGHHQDADISGGGDGLAVVGEGGEAAVELRSYPSKESIRKGYRNQTPVRKGVRVPNQSVSPSPRRRVLEGVVGTGAINQLRKRPSSIRVDLSEPSPPTSPTEEEPLIRLQPSASGSGSPYSPLAGHNRPPIPPDSPRSRRSQSSTPGGRRQRVWSTLSPLDVVASPDVMTSTSSKSPLARLYGNRVASGEPLSAAPSHPGTHYHHPASAALGFGHNRAQGETGFDAVRIENSMKKIETMLQDAKELPVHKLKEEMKELQDRQARIENLLLMLTRGMRNEVGGRQGSI